MTDMDHTLKGVTVDQFVETLRDAVANLGVVHPPDLRAPLALWLRAVESQAVGQQWRHLLGRPVVSEWNAARAVVDAAEAVSDRPEPVVVTSYRPVPDPELTGHWRQFSDTVTSTPLDSRHEGGPT